MGTTYMSGERVHKPKNCRNCVFNDSNCWCHITKGIIDRDDYSCDIECPIKELPVGVKLIDVNALLKKADDVAYLVAHGFRFNDIEMGITLFGLQQLLEEQDVIIET